MNLVDLLDGLIESPSIIKQDVVIKGIALDSRKVSKGFLFIAVSGAVEHGLVYLEAAINNGASVVIYDPLGSDSVVIEALNVQLIAVNDLSSKLGRLADRFYQSPSKIVDVIAVTGTNGKTTCSQFLLQVLPGCGVIGTLGWGYKNSRLKGALNTTPDAIAVQGILAEFVDKNRQTVVMEVSSHGLQQGRVNNVFFKGAVFTNLSRDHLDYHGTMDNYLQTKLTLFKRVELAFVVVNADDDRSDQFLAVVQPQVKRWVFSATQSEKQLSEKAADEYVRVEEVNCSLNGISFLLCWQQQKIKIQTMIVGDFNLENILAVITVQLALGVSLNEIAEKMNNLLPVSGRMERFGGEGKPFVFVDYAHTPDALEKLLKGLRKYCQHQLRVVFGCGGGRDKGKRLEMGMIAEKYADQVILSTDNPRFENADQIFEDIAKGLSANNFMTIADREKAIQAVIKNANEFDCVVVAGKGHEEYQEIKGVRKFFRDQNVVEQALLEWVDVA